CLLSSLPLGSPLSRSTSISPETSDEFIAGLQVSRRTDRQPVGQTSVRVEADQPFEQTKVSCPRDRYRPGRGVRCGFARRTGISGECPVHTGQPSPSSLDRRTGRNKRGEKLPQ